MPVIELTSYRAKPGVPDDAVVAAVTGARAWMRAQPGFLTHRLLREADGTWTDLAEWADMATAQAAHQAFNPTDPALAPLMAVFDPATLVMRHADQVA